MAISERQDGTKSLQRASDSCQFLLAKCCHGNLQANCTGKNVVHKRDARKSGKREKKGMRLTFIFASILSRSPKKERDWGREEGKNKMTDVLTRAVRGRSKALQ